MSYDVVIIGAGIVGAACAAECAREGLRVAIVEAGIIGGGATAAGMGHLVVMDDSEAQFALTRYSQQLWDEVSAERDSIGRQGSNPQSHFHCIKMCCTSIRTDDNHTVHVREAESWPRGCIQLRARLTNESMPEHFLSICWQSISFDV